MSHVTPADAGSVPASTTDRPASGVSRLVVVAGFVILLLSYLLNAMDRQVFFSILPSIRSEYGFSLTRGGTLATAFTLGMTVAGLPTGYLMDRFSRKTILVVSIVIYSLGTLATPLSAGFADMATYRVVSGIGEGMQSTALFAAIGTYFFHRRTFALGCSAVAYGTGNFFGPLIGVHLANSFDTWRAPFVAFGTFGLAIAMIALFAVSSRLTEHADVPVASAEIDDRMPASPYNRNSIALAVSAAVSGLVVYGFLGLYPTFLTNGLHYTSGHAALATSFVGFGGMLALIPGWFGDRLNQRNLLIVTYLALSATSLLVYQTRPALGWECLIAFFMGFFGTGALYTNHNSAIQRAVRPDQIGRAVGLFITSYYVSSAFSGTIFGALVNHLGWSRAGLWQVTLLPALAIISLTFARGSASVTAVKRLMN